jgi:catecholate siderophore receptor
MRVSTLPEGIVHEGRRSRQRRASHGGRRRRADVARACNLRLDPLWLAVRSLVAGASLGVVMHPVSAQSSRETRDSPVDEIVITKSRDDGYRVDDNSLSKLTESIRDTPQSIATLSRELIDDRGATSLNDALRDVPGITLGAGEFSWQGNNPSIRGFSARDDLYLDGLRDFGSYARDPFNLEAVEILLGPSSVLFGRGSTGGAINQVTKAPHREDATDVAVNVGSASTYRATADLSRPLGGAAAFRLNLLAHEGGVVDRDGAASRRYGIAPSVAFGLGSPTELTLSYVHQSSDDRPDYGLPWLDGRPAAVPRDNYYGFESDYSNTDADLATVHVRHDVGERVRLDAQLRSADYSRRNRITEPLITPVPPAGTPLDAISVYRYVFGGDSDETLRTAQLTASLDLGAGALRHALVTGVELARETSSPVFAFGIGVPSTSLVDPNWHEVFSATSFDPRIVADTKAVTTALFALDTLKLKDSWLVTLGLRLDRFDTDYSAERFAGPPTPFNSGTESGTEAFSHVDDVASYRAAVVYKPAERTSFYAAGSTSFNPSAQSLSLLTSGRGLGTENALLNPEKNRSVELGAKLDLKDSELSLSSAVFEITKTNARVADPTNPGFNTLGGEQRVRGASIDVTGRLTPRIYLASGYAYLDGEVVRGAAGATTGARLANTPEHSLSIWVDYRATNRLDFGFGGRYVGAQLAQNTGAGRRVPGYSVLDVMARYRFSGALVLKLNLTNLTDELYFEQLHPWHVIPGPGRTAMLAIDMAF